jgi:nicotinate-nucleotide adenylyltransferase
VVKKFNPDKILFIPSFNPPLKDKNLASFDDRLAMCKLATNDNYCFEVSDIESKIIGKSYTVKTLELLKKQYKTQEKFNFLIGIDAFANIDNWFQPQKLAENVKFLVLNRKENTKLREIQLKNLDYQILDNPYINISSSEIRDLAKSNKSLKNLVTTEVEEYIKTKKLYRKD